MLPISADIGAIEEDFSPSLRTIHARHAEFGALRLGCSGSASHHDLLRCNLPMSSMDPSVYYPDARDYRADLQLLWC